MPVPLIIMSELFDYEKFAGSLNTVYVVALPAGKAVELRLAEVSKLRGEGNWRNFSITLRGPGHTFLPQGIYTLASQNQPDEFSLFLVPVGRDTEGFIYEAVFNYQVG